MASENSLIVRKSIHNLICEQLFGNQKSSINIFGGPKTGKTSLLKSIAYDSSLKYFPQYNDFIRVFFDGQAVGSTMSPELFWMGIFREMSTKKISNETKQEIEKNIEKIKNGELNFYSLEDLFSSLVESNTSVLVIITNFHIVLKNKKFWPPHDFFHQIRSLAQEFNSNLNFIVSTPRPLIDLWDASKGASPFYNIFFSVNISKLKKDESIEFMRGVIEKQGDLLNDELLDFIYELANGHPYIISHLLNHCLTALKNKKAVNEKFIELEYLDENGKITELNRQMRQYLNNYEKEVLDKAYDGKKLTENENELLIRLQNNALIPPIN